MGSSRSTNDGSLISAWAMPMRCSIPLEYLRSWIAGGALETDVAPAAVDPLAPLVPGIARTVARRSAGTRGRSGSRRSRGSRACSRCRSLATATSTRPLLGLIRPSTCLSVVVLPAPLGPSRPTTSPSRTVRVAPFRISTGRRAKPTFTVLCRSSTTRTRWTRDALDRDSASRTLMMTPSAVSCQNRTHLSAGVARRFRARRGSRCAKRSVRAVGGESSPLAERAADGRPSHTRRGGRLRRPAPGQSHWSRSHGTTKSSMDMCPVERERVGTRAQGVGVHALGARAAVVGHRRTRPGVVGPLVDLGADLAVLVDLGHRQDRRRCGRRPSCRCRARCCACHP